MMDKNVRFTTDLQFSRVWLSEVGGTARSEPTPRSRPERTPELAADREHTYERSVSKSEDEAFHVLDRANAIKALSKALEVGRIHAEEFLDLGIQGLKPVKPYSKQKGRGHLFRSSDVEDWAKQYKERKGKKSEPPWKSGMQASDARRFVDDCPRGDIDSEDSMRQLFGDRDDRFRREGGQRYFRDSFFRSRGFQR